MNEETLQTIMGLITHGGDAKSKAFEAIFAAKEANFELAETKLQEANEAVNRAHKSQTAMLTKEAMGEHVELSILLIHGQDHLMNALTAMDLAKEIVTLYQHIETRTGDEQV